MGREPHPRKTFRRLREGEAELPPEDLSVWRTRISRIEHLREMMTQFQDQAFMKQAKYYDRRHRDEQFKIGDLVKKPNQVLSDKGGHIAAKLAPKFCGPYVVVEVISPNIYKLASQDGRLAGRYHASHLQKYIPDQEEEPNDPENDAELDRILLEISDSETEEVNDVHENPELQFNWGLDDVDSQSNAEVETTNRV